MEEDPNLWFHDTINPDFVQMYRVREILYSGESQFQSVQIIQTSSFGRCLILDGKVQSSEKDEFIYHEALVHPAMITHPSPAAVFIAGGGEGATLREVLNHRTVEKVVMVDIDQEAVDICRRFLPSLHQNSFDDSRAQLLHLDAREYLTNCEQQFDVIIMDLTDPVEEGPSCLLYTREFYSLVMKRLTPRGIICVQAGSCGWGEMGVFVAVSNTLRTVFPLVFPYRANVPSFGGEWGFALASLEPSPLSLSKDEVDNRVSARTCRSPRFYDGVTHQGMFCLPLYLRQAMSSREGIVTDKTPLSLR